MIKLKYQLFNLDFQATREGGTVPLVSFTADTDEYVNVFKYRLVLCLPLGIVVVEVVIFMLVVVVFAITNNFGKYWQQCKSLLVCLSRGINSPLPSAIFSFCLGKCNYSNLQVI